MLFQTKALENTVDERNPDTYKYLTLDELQKETDKILEHSQIKVSLESTSPRTRVWEEKWENIIANKEVEEDPSFLINLFSLVDKC